MAPAGERSKSSSCNKSPTLPDTPLLPVGSFVFARLRGHEAWPAKIKEISIEGTEGENNQRYVYKVKFYGTYDFATLEERNIFPYNEYVIKRNKKYLPRSGRKREQYERAIREVDEDIEWIKKQSMRRSEGS